MIVYDYVYDIDLSNKIQKDMKMTNLDNGMHHDDELKDEGLSSERLELPFDNLQGLSPDTLEGLYSCAYDLYNKGRLNEAEQLFKFLCVYDFYNSEYLKGYAAVRQLKKEYQHAIDLYALSFNASKSNDYSPIFYMGQCLLCLKKPEQAKECFDEVRMNSNDAELKTKAEKYFLLLKEIAPSNPEDAKIEES